MNPANARGRKRLNRIRVARRAMLAAAALPILQTAGCYPDIIGALNFEIQSLINSVLINAANVVIQNLLGL